MKQIIEAFMVILVGIILLPPIKAILEIFDTDIMPHGIMSVFEEFVFDLFPIALLVLVLLAVVLIFIKKRKNREEE